MQKEVGVIVKDGDLHWGLGSSWAVRLPAGFETVEVKILLTVYSIFQVKLIQRFQRHRGEFFDQQGYHGVALRVADGG